MKKLVSLSLIILMMVTCPATTAGVVLDVAFGTLGKVTTDFSGRFDVASGIVIQPDGKVVVGGVTSTPCGQGYDSAFALARYNADGSLDQNFGSGGRATADFGYHGCSFSVLSWAHALALQPD